ncbi:hypothetical protein pdam_00024816 [Pocillopora damicornis]|uniref:Uncharacterized protein n=1 Tax=Pocillopora damicornis TaxID=46731 RepID=A0A3M6TRT0_POCDA|nr:hypothetical protein pdam_00024816 [Pocillopora damicornis]
MKLTSDHNVPPENQEVHPPSHKEHVNLLLNEIRKLRDQIATLREEGKANQEAHEAAIQQRNEKECASKKQMDEKEKALKKQMDEKEKALKKQVDEKEKALKREMKEKGKWFKYALISFSIIIVIISVIGFRSFGDVKGQMDGKDQALQTQLTTLYYIAGIAILNQPIDVKTES